MQKKQTRLAGIILAICCILAVIVFFQTRPDTTVGEKRSPFLSFIVTAVKAHFPMTRTRNIWEKH